MRKIVLVSALVILAIALPAGWQIASVYLDNIELHDDLKDAAAQNGVNIGLNSPKSDDQMRKEVIDTAAEHRLRLQPDQITLQKHAGPRSDDPSAGRISYDITVDYTAHVNLLVYSYSVHFVQSNR